MAQPVTVNNVQVYPLSSGKAIPQWLSAAKRKQLNRSDPNFARRIELLQDFSFPEASHCIRTSEDGRYVITTGTYHPRVRVWDTTELSMKFERYMDSASVAFCSVSDDYSKLAFLQEDRHVELHARYGRHYRTRIPVAGRHMVWHAPTAELLMSTSSNEVYRLSLDEGRFLAPLAIKAPASNQIAVSRITALIGVACEGGTVEMWDPRGPDQASILRLPAHAAPSARAPLPNDATCLAFEESGLGLVVGTADARALVYDLRKAVPLCTKSHPYNMPVKTVAFHRGGGVAQGGAAGAGVGTSVSGQKLVLSSDAKQIKLWHRDDGKTFTNIEGNAPLNQVCIISDSPGVGGGDSGLILATSEQERVQSYYVPALGLAPRWAAFLDSLTEELAEGEGPSGGSGADAAAGAGGTGVYDDFRFVTRTELADMGLEHLIGTPLLRAYMHGFFMDQRLYSRVRSVLDGAAGVSYETVKKQRVAEQLAAGRGTRVLAEGAKEAPKVNAELAKRLQKSAPSAPAAAKMAPTNLLADDRFARLFSDSSFAIDPEEAEVIAVARGQPLAKGKGGRDGAEEEEEEGRGGRGVGAGKGAKGGKRKRRQADSDEEDGPM